MHDVKKLFLLILTLGLFGATIPETRAQSNTLVRFRISYGANVLGNIDVELFDQDKPATVSNFLAYVDSGRFKRTFLHRLIPGFIIQGGSGTIVNPYSAALFQVVKSIPKDPAITNEFNVGSFQPNLLGTIAMAKVAGDTNSATSSWFFNIANNSANRGTNVENLDTQNGGFTVFGRAYAGTNLFTTFNGLSHTRGIMAISDIFYTLGCGVIPLLETDGSYEGFVEGTDVPVSFLGNYCVRYSDLLVVDIFRLTNVITDATSPTVTIQSPAANTILTTTAIDVTGTAADAGGLASVDVILNHERLTVATGTTNWSATLTNAIPGTNTLTVVAIDRSANQSKPTFRNVFVRQQQNLDLTVTPGGTVTGLTNGQAVDLNRNYQLIAKPAPGYLFSRWQGSHAFAIGSSGEPTDPTLNCYFYPATNAWLRAVFVPNPFIPTKGTYSGLFSETNTLQKDLAGFVTLTVTDRGTYSGKLTIEGKPVPFKGQLQLSGATSTSVTRNGSNDLFLNLTLDVSNGTHQVTGTLRFLSGGQRVARLIADLPVYNIRTNPAPRAGQYTLVLPGAPAGSGSPHGDSYGTVKIDGNGKITFAGVLADGSKFTQKTALSKDDTWPFFGSLYAGKGIALGWLDVVTGNPSTDIVGDVGWHKSPAAGGVYYPSGFLKFTNAIGSRFIKPLTATNRVIEIPTGTLALTGGNLNPEFSNAVTIAPNSAVTTTSPNKLTLTLNKSTGLMSGTVVHPSGAPTLKFTGVVLQQHQIGGYGFFLGTSESGRARLTGP